MCYNKNHLRKGRYRGAGKAMNVQKKKHRYQIRFLIFMVLSIGLLWFYTQSAQQYQTEQRGIWQLLPYFWFALTILWAILAFHYQKLNLKQQNTDVLTGGLNERAFRLAVEEKIKEYDHRYAFVIVDIKKFGRIENWYNHEVGDQVLKKVYEALGSCLKEGELFCRAGADQFYLLLKEADPEEVQKRMYALDDAVYFLKDLPIREKLFLSMGAYLITGEQDTFAHAVDCANYCRKESPDYEDRNSHLEIYGYTFKDHRERDRRYHERAEAALEAGHFHMYLQPKYELKEERLAGAEALFRWIDPERGMLPLGEFMPLFEKNGFVRQIDYYIFESSLKLLQKWIDQGVEPVKISVNLSRSHFTNQEFFEKQFLPIYEKYRVPKELLEFEISENTMLDGGGMLINFVQKLKDMGFSCSMDDFGSGYSSLNTLKSIPVSTIKLDGKMFEEKEKERGKIVSKGIIQIARELQIEVVAEGVETREYVDFLKEQKCDLIQGFYFGKPMPVEEFESRMKEERQRE